MDLRSIAAELWCDIFVVVEWVASLFISCGGRLKIVLASDFSLIGLPPFNWRRTSCIRGRFGFFNSGNCCMYSCWIECFLRTRGHGLAERSTILIGVGYRNGSVSAFIELRFLTLAFISLPALTSYTLLWRFLPRPPGDLVPGLRFSVSVSYLLVNRSLLQLVKFKFFMFLWSCKASKLIGVWILRRCLLRVIALLGAMNSPFWKSCSCWFGGFYIAIRLLRSTTAEWISVYGYDKHE